MIRTKSLGNQNAANKIILKYTDDGCLVCTSHKMNPDGYFRKRINGEKMMYHRHIWEKYNGPIPEGYEVDHLCKNRGCCKIGHLQILLTSEHRSKDGMERYGNFTGIPRSKKNSKESCNETSIQDESRER